MIALIRKAVELGVTFFDTAELYGFGRSEKLLGEFKRNIPQKLVIAAHTMAGEEIRRGHAASKRAPPTISPGTGSASAIAPPTSRTARASITRRVSRFRSIRTSDRRP